MTLSSLSREPRVEAMLEERSSIVSGRSTRMAEPARLEQLTDDLKTPQKASGLFFGPSVSFNTISDHGKAPKALSSGSTDRNSKLLCLRLKINVLNLVTRLAWEKTGILINAWSFHAFSPFPFFQLCAPASVYP